MEKPLIFLLIVGFLIGIGMVLSFYGTQLATQNLTITEENLESGSSMDVTAELDPAFSETGVYGILLSKYEENMIHVTVFEPSESQILSKTIDQETTEERFEINSKGTYRVTIENSGLEQIKIVAGIGYMPDSNILSVGIIGFYIILVGLIGMGGIVVNLIRNKRKEKFN
ncbi:MAG TPA: hypothetical protein VD731_06655 [Nitrosopumilaceae archaeon]|nr:hypothetical protein [Nitrosopumilaceae archaeon]